MRRQPDTTQPEPTGSPYLIGPDRAPPPQWQADAITPFLVSGGATFYIVQEIPPFDPQPDGAQLICFVYVPKGAIAFLKEIRVAPFMPPELADPWEGRGAVPVPPLANPNLWRIFNGEPAVRAAGTHGVWQTPFGWESYFAGGGTPPSWTWSLRIMAGDLAQQRNPAPFNLGDATTWALQPNVAVPAAAYPGGLPGRQPSGFWASQRMQVLQGDKLSTHVMVPEHNTLCLFARWTQEAIAPESTAFAGEGTVIGEYGPPVFPLLPSFGQLHGYIQPAASAATMENARYGWEG